jgi:hypothetical protein
MPASVDLSMVADDLQREASAARIAGRRRFPDSACYGGTHPHGHVTEAVAHRGYSGCSDACNACPQKINRIAKLHLLLSDDLAPFVPCP